LPNQQYSPICKIYADVVYKCCACTSCTIKNNNIHEWLKTPGLHKTKREGKMAETQPSQEEKKTVRIKMKVGNIEFEIECREDQVQAIVEKVLSTVTEHVKKATPSFREAAQPTGRAETCRGILERLWREKFFAEPRSLSEVHEEMTRIGYHYDRTAVAHVLLDLVRDGILTREGKPRRYVYVQKRPPST